MNSYCLTASATCLAYFKRSMYSIGNPFRSIGNVDGEGVFGVYRGCMAISSIGNEGVVFKQLKGFKQLKEKEEKGDKNI